MRIDLDFVEELMKERYAANKKRFDGLW